MWRALPLFFGLSVFACNESHSCTLVQCIGVEPQLAFVDEGGVAVTASGERRTTSQPEPRTFTCAGQEAPDGGSCGGGLIRFADVGGSGITRQDVLEVRFLLSDGSYSAWQPVPFEVEGHTNPDFNGPGCPCSWDDITIEPVVVPAGARLDARGHYLFPES